MKIAVYTIAKNELQFCEAWARSAADADYRIVADTGSTDGTQDALRALGVTVTDISVVPWRFDVARNLSLAAVPDDADICITLDMDEQLQPGWRQAVEAAWVPGTTRLHYRYVWNWNPDGTPGITFLGERAHARQGYFWKHPVHETLKPVAGLEERHVYTEDCQIHHHADNTKPRSQYLPLLEMAAAESPEDDRCSHYLGREFMYYGRYHDAINELTRHLSLPSALWVDERAASYRYLGRCHEALGDNRSAKRSYLHACGEQPDSREPWYEMAEFCRKQEDWLGGVYAIQQCLITPECVTSYLSDPRCRGAGPYDTGAVCAWYAGMKDLAAAWMREALDRSPNDRRLQSNAEIILGFLADRAAE